MAPFSFLRRRPWTSAICTLTVAAVPITANASKNDNDARPDALCSTSTPFTSGTEGYHTFRIPALVRSGKTLIAFAEGRRTSAEDHGDIEVVSKRSTNGGCSWGPLSRVSDNGRNVAGNPAPVVDPASGRIILLTVRQPAAVTQPQIEAGTVASAASRRVYVQRSGDAGATWSRPTEITSAVKRPEWRWYATGPGHGIALTRQRPGRLVVAANHTTAKGSGAHLLYSDNHGGTWHIGAVDHHNGKKLRPDENAVAELPDGRLYVNARDQGGTDPATRLDTYSADGGTSFSAPYRPRPDLVAPVVKGALLHSGTTNCPALLFSAPDHPKERRHLTLRRSSNSGATWVSDTVLAAGPAAYSDLAMTGAKTVAALYETGRKKATERIDLRRVPLTCR
ncbi:sialidase family protein [Streptomyces zagrosensis]|uniref:exo-alpha-sialidase n=1 Tax=Streptomyces zagrosensis TaxID=1042984 RepID=A0A7W9QEL9_9ACTN|nr:sialidase family protein [Streptomyces zagrosensis]MBB5938293.1 sialidase-1 [Streptomyces zagrosensis]